MPREGYLGITLDLEVIEEIDKIRKNEMIRTNPEAIRFLIREYKKQNNQRIAHYGLEHINGGIISPSLSIET